MTLYRLTPEDPPTPDSRLTWLGLLAGFVFSTAVWLGLALLIGALVRVVGGG